ncbi:MAG: hypothetical protein IJ099_07365 [Alphaproteobacteria bacterium]|nr:hypothetical protein [Alphaproteobacteria bacterium]
MTDNNDKLKQLYKKTMPEFKSRDEFYAYVADHSDVTISLKQAYKQMQDNLLPVFKAAKELCEYISGDDEYFLKTKNNLYQLYHMALVSRMINNINTNSGTVEEKKASLRLSEPHYRGMIYIKNGKKTRETTPFEKKQDKGFKDIFLKSNIGLSVYEDMMTTIYYGAFQNDVFSDVKEERIASVHGNFLNWQVAKNSHVLKVACEPFIRSKMAQMAQENGFDFSDRFRFYQASTLNIQAKINAFCDIKQTQFINQMQQQTQSEVKS